MLSVLAELLELMLVIHVYRTSKVTPKCPHCNKPITFTLMAAMDKTGHPDLFLCAHCNKPITDKVVAAMGKTWHPDHFTCVHCNKPITETVVPAMSKTGHPDHFTCELCNKPITNAVVSAMGKTWHPDHFTCAHCKKPIKEASFHVQNGKPYCEADYTKLYGNNCYACGQLIKNTILTALNKTYHEECFKCTKCQKPIALKEFTEKNGSPFCMACGRI